MEGQLPGSNVARAIVALLYRRGKASLVTAQIPIRALNETPNETPFLIKIAVIDIFNL